MIYQSVLAQCYVSPFFSLHFANEFFFGHAEMEIDFTGA